MADSAYRAVSSLGRWGETDNLVIVTRLAGNRTVYRSPPLPTAAPGKGHPPWYGERFALGDPATWDPPQDTLTLTTTTAKGRVLTIHLELWYELKLRGKRNLPMHRYPFTFIRGTVTDQDGRAVFQRPQWLIVFGQRRREITAQHAWDAYRQRYDLEHFFRFGKQRLLMAGYQTPVVEHEENGWQLTSLALCPTVVGSTAGSGPAQSVGTVCVTRLNRVAAQPRAGAAGLRTNNSPVWPPRASAQTPG